MVAALSMTNRCTIAASGNGISQRQTATTEVNCHSAHTPAAAWMRRWRLVSSTALADST